MPTISVNIGNGLKFNGNKITTNWVSGNISKEDDGLYIPDLSGKDGGAGGTTIDNYTIIDANKNTGTIKTNREVVQYIFSMSAWKVTNTTKSGYSIDEDGTLKTKADFISEVNRVISSYQYTAYNIRVGDLILFRYWAHPIKYDNWTKTIDDGNRYTSDVCLALFVVNSVSGTMYGSAQYINDCELECLWCRDDIKAKGSSYGWTPGGILS